jgi:UDP-N-acetylglucosamine--dolichyl-phosphate N-acetylglucosaminephosphotransferase
MGSVELGGLYLYFVVPAYVMVTANLANMHSGFNGLASGTALLVLFSLILKSAMTGGVENLLFAFPLLGIALAFHYYNLYPSQIFEGDVGSFMLGSAIGIVIILQKLELIGFVMLIPHIVNFLMYAYWKIKGIPHVKFGRVCEDGTLEVPNPLTLKWLLPYYFKVTERTCVLFTYCLTVMFCTIGLMMPR